MDATLDRNSLGRYEVKLTFAELALIYKSLQAARTLALQAHAELLDDTLHLIDQALLGAVSR